MFANFFDSLTPSIFFTVALALSTVQGLIPVSPPMWTSHVKGPVPVVSLSASRPLAAQFHHKHRRARARSSIP